MHHEIVGAVVEADVCVAAAAVQRVVAGVALQAIVAETAAQRVVPEVAEQGVVAVATGDGVGAVSALERELDRGGDSGPLSRLYGVAVRPRF